ncbi:MAG: hypothetical protein M3Q42_00585 [Pseudomonadota bacterium]|nr:hypothetical protein [Pseudomonadota bacterium]
MSQASVCQIVREPREVRRELDELGIDESFVRSVSLAAASARADALPIDPKGAPGTLSYLMGVRAKRLILLPRGWRASTLDNIEATVNHELGVQLVFQNVGRACADNDPEPVSAKGPASRRLVQSGQGELFFTPMNRRVVTLGQAPKVWLLCVSADDESVQAEVSCPKVFEGGMFEGFDKRIFVVDESFAPDIGHDPSRSTNDDPGLDFDVVVTRK